MRFEVVTGANMRSSGIWRHVDFHQITRLYVELWKQQAFGIECPQAVTNVKMNNFRLFGCCHCLNLQGLIYWEQGAEMTFRMLGIRPISVEISRRNEWLSLYGSTALVDIGRFCSFLILYTVCRTPWTGDQPIARPLPIHRITQMHNKRIHTSMPRMGFEPTIPVFERAKTVHALDHAATVIGDRYVREENYYHVSSRICWQRFLWLLKVRKIVPELN
jgi:hypothetical protein